MAKPRSTTPKKRDDARAVAFDPRAPDAERFDANAELQKSHTDLSSLIPREDIKPVIDWIVNDLANSAMMKGSVGNIVPFPQRKRPGGRGMQSVQVDDMWINVQGDWWEKPGNMGFDAMRAMVDQTPVLSAVVLTRIRQVQSFCRVQESGRGNGFVIRHIERDHQLSREEQQSVDLLQKFFTNCGWEPNPRRRKALKRDSFPQFMAKLVRDSLGLDSAPIETEFKRDKALGIDGMYAVDGATIRLCTEQGYRGNDEVFALQVVQNMVRTAYTYEELVYEPRNPRSDVLVSGYGMGETEILIRVVTGFLNALTLNIKGFTDSAIPRGVLHLSGNYGKEDLEAFKRYWNAMVRGVNNAWALPVLVSKDQESKAEFSPTGVEFDEMYFSKWMTFLTAIICAVYGMDPTEINFESFAASKSSLSGNDTGERLVASYDKGLRPLLSYFDHLFSDYIVSEFSDAFVFRFTGLDEADEKTRAERVKLVLTIDEVRAMDGFQPMDSPLGACPINPSLVQPWLQIMQASAPQDFGAPPGAGGEPGVGDPDGSTKAAPILPPGAEGGAPGAPEGGQGGPTAGAPAAGAPLVPPDSPLAKALDFGTVLPAIYEVDA